MPKCTVKDVKFNREWSPEKASYTIYYFDIEVEDDEKGTVKGFFSTNKKDQDKFLVGQQYNYKIIPGKEDKNGMPKIDIIDDKQENNKGKVKGKKWKRDPSVRRSIIAQSSFDCAVNAVIAIIENYPELKVQDKITGTVQVNHIAIQMMSWVAKHSSNNEQMEIICQTALKRAIDMIKIKELEIKSTEKILETAESIKSMLLENANKLNEYII